MPSKTRNASHRENDGRKRKGKIKQETKCQTQTEHQRHHDQDEKCNWKIGKTMHNR